MPEARNKDICTECGTVRTVLQIRKILEIPQNVDVLTFIREMKEKLDKKKNIKLVPRPNQVLDPEGSSTLAGWSKNIADQAKIGGW